MTPESVMMMGTEAMKIAIAVAAPLLLVALVMKEAAKAIPITSVLAIKPNTFDTSMRSGR